MIEKNKKDTEIEKLLSIMKDLRDPKKGCDWDKKQTFETLLNYTIEETFEVVDAIKSKNTKNIIEELGDLLLQIVFYAQIADEKGMFNFSDISKSVKDKMIRRHPHVFNKKNTNLSIEEINANWDKIKKIEKKVDPDEPILIGNYRAFPNLLKSYKIQNKVSQMKFEFLNIDEIFDKLDEETNEIKSAIKEKNKYKIEEELGDLLFTVANLSTFLKINPEIALHQSNNKFIKRFNYISKEINKNNESFDTISREKLEILWQKSKQEN